MAADSATAQALFDRAKELMRGADYAEACPALEESQRIEPRSGTLLNLGDCYERSGRLASAWGAFLDAATMAKAGGSPERERVARERAAALMPRLSNLVIDAPFAASTPGLEIMRDGLLVGSAQYALPLPADAGGHVIAAKAPGRKPWQANVSVQDGASTATVTVPELERTSSGEGARAAAPPAAGPATPQGAAPSSREPDHPAPNRLTTGVIVGGGATGALLVGTVVSGLLYQSKLHEYDKANAELAANRGALRSQTQTIGATNLALLGGAVVAAGVTVFLWTRPPSNAAVSARFELTATAGPVMTGFRLLGTL